MSKVLIWSELAESDLIELSNYLKENWSERVLSKFYFKLESTLARIQNNPRQFPFLNKSLRYRKCVLTRQNTIYYKEYKKHVLILRVFDTRKNPKKRGL